VKAFIGAHQSLTEAQAMAPDLAARLKRIPTIERYVPATSGLSRQVEKMYRELEAIPTSQSPMRVTRHMGTRAWRVQPRRS